MSPGKGLDRQIEALLPRVGKPARYAGGEWNSVRKDHRSVEVLFALAFPDVYEIGMSHLGSIILYHELNRRPDVACERVYSPWVDMETELRRGALPLFTLESRRPVGDFDILGLSLQYEMNFSNVLNLLDLAGVPLRADQRGAGHPLVLAGGPCALNPEPLADFLDAVVVGEGEEAVHEVVNVYRDWQRQGRAGREDLLRALAAVPGVYVPSLYRVDYHRDGTVAEVRPAAPGVPERITRRAVADLDRLDYPTRPVVPYLEVVHDRAMVEIFRGCTRGCRFCQAGNIYRPVRERSPGRVRELAQALVDATGHQELSLASLSSSDYSAIEYTARTLVDEGLERGVGISLPSLRTDAFSVGLARQVQRVRKTGLTFAPEAGTQRLRDVINKGVTAADLTAAAESAFAHGWRALKLYFMVGLPTEEYPDLDGIAGLVHEVDQVYRRVAGGGPPLRLTVSLSPFVPKAHTPFQWEPQLPLEELEARQAYLRRRIPRRVRLSWHDPRLSRVEAVFARGDRRLAAALQQAWETGARFDSWSEHFSYDRWSQAFAAAGLDPAFYANRRRPAGEVFAWDHLEPGVSKGFLRREWERAHAAEPTGDCRFDRCSACGVCDQLGLKPAAPFRGGEEPFSA